MNRITKIIHDTCPNGVRYKHIWEVTEWDKNFNSVEKYKQKKVIKYKYLLAKDLKALEDKEGNVKLLSTGVYDGFTTEKKAGSYLSEGEVVTIPWGGTAIVKYYKGMFCTADNRIATSLDTNILNNKFLYYYLIANSNLIQSFYRGSSIQHPNMKSVLDFLIPVPPIEIQNEIVQILDKLSELEDSLKVLLEAELFARNKQYDYFRNKLLDFSFDYIGIVRIDMMIKEMCPNGIESKRLKDIGTMFFRGKGIRREELTDSGIPCIRYGDIYTKYDDFVTEVNQFTKIDFNNSTKYAEYGDLLFAITGETIEDIGKTITYIGNDKILVGGDIAIMKHNQNPKFLAYMLNSKKNVNQKIKGKNKNKVVHMSLDDIKSLVIPLPPIEIQTEVVRIIDEYRALLIDIKQKLLAEINAREKQYKYLRDLLLAFR